MKTILIVDDESAIAELLADALSDVGYQVLVARHGREALAAVEVVRVDLVLCDLMMPVLDGVGFCRRMHASPPHAHIPIVLMSAAQRNGIPPDCAYAAFIGKPFQLDALLGLVSQLLVERPV